MSATSPPGPSSSTVAKIIFSNNRFFCLALVLKSGPVLTRVGRLAI